MLQDRLRDWAAARGYGLAIAGTNVIEAVREKLEERKSAGMIDAGFFNPLRGIPRTLVRGGIANSPLRGQALQRLQRVDPTDVSPWSFSKIFGESECPRRPGRQKREKNIGMK